MVDLPTPAAAGLRYPVEPDEKYKASVLFIAKGGKSAGQCSLYFPEAVNFSDGLVYDNANLGVAGEIARRASSGMRTGDIQTMAKSITAAAAESGARLSEISTSGMDTFGSTQNLKSLLDKGAPIMSIGVQKIAETLGAQEIASGVAAGTQITANPHKRSVFRDVALRTFTFSFLMSPQSSAESSSIENIVDFFRANAYPDRISGGLGYKFPTEFKIEFLYKNGKMSQAPKILPCYITSVNTVLNPRSSSFFEDGKANEVQLTMSFQEERALNKDDIKDGY